MTPRLPIVALVGAVVVVTGCFTPAQNGGVEVFRGAERRLEAFCRFGRGETRSEVCANAAPSLPPARVFQISSRDQLLGGPHALGRVGDVALDNGEIVAIVSQLGPTLGRIRGGELLDLADAVLRVDELGAMRTVLVSAGRPGGGDLGASAPEWLPERIETGEADGTAFISVHGRAPGCGDAEVVTRYELAPGQRVLHVVTELRAGPASPPAPRATRCRIGDEIAWGGVSPRGAEDGFQPDSPVQATGRFAGYAFLPSQPWSRRSSLGHTGALLVAGRGPAPASPSSPSSPSSATPARAAIHHRFVAVAVRGDSLALAAELTHLGGGALGALTVGFEDGGRRIDTPQSGCVVLTPAVASSASPSTGGGYDRLEAELAAAAAEPSRDVAFEVPAGDYMVTFEAEGQRAAESVAVRVDEGTMSTVSVGLGAAGRLDVAIGDGAPATMWAVREGGDDAGAPEMSVPPRPVLRGGASRVVAPGVYRVFVARGPAFGIAEATVTVARGEVAKVALTPPPVSETIARRPCGWVRDVMFGVPSTSPASRVASVLAAGARCVWLSERGAVPRWEQGLEGVPGLDDVAFTAFAEGGGPAWAPLTFGGEGADAAWRGEWVRLVAAAESPSSSMWLPSEAHAQWGGEGDRMPLVFAADAGGDGDVPAVPLSGGAPLATPISLVLTDGPLLTVHQRRAGGHRTLELVVDAAPWVELESLEVRRGDVALHVLPLAEPGRQTSVEVPDEGELTVVVKARVRPGVPGLDGPLLAVTSPLAPLALPPPTLVAPRGGAPTSP
jgi:hypothetical protein